MTRVRTREIAAILAAALIACAGPARAECVHNGEAMDEGARVGDYVCEGGRWVERPG